MPIYTQTIIADGPVAFWRLNDHIQSGAVVDYSTFATHQGGVRAGVTLGGASAVLNDTTAGSALFDGSSGFIDVAETAQLQLNAAFSVEFWINPTMLLAGTFPNVLSQGNGSATGWEVYINATGRTPVLKRAGVDGLGASNNRLTVGAWTHFVFTYDGSNAVKVYFNGVLDQTYTGKTFATNTDTSDLRLASEFNGANFGPINLAEVAIYTAALSAGQVAAHYSSGTTGTVPVVTGGKAVPTYDVELAIASVLANVFTIGTSTIGGSDVVGGGPTPVFNNITPDTMNFSVKRGRTANLDTVTQGTAQITLTDPTGKYNPAGGYSNAVIADQPWAFLRLDELSGTTAVDQSGMGNAGTYSGTGVVYGVLGPLYDGDTGVRLDGSSGQITIPFATWMQLNGQFTLECWVQQNASQFYTLMQHGDPASTGWEFFVLSGGTPGFQKHAQAATNFPSAVIGNGAWHHLVVTFDSQLQSNYLDGVLVASATYPGGYGTDSGTQNITIGGGGAFAPISIGQVAIYAYALSASRVAAHFAARLQYGSAIQPMLPVKISSKFYDYATTVLNDTPTGWWRMGDNKTTTVAADASGAGNVGNVTSAGVLFQQSSDVLDGSPAAYFDGIVGGIDVPYRANLNFTSHFSVECLFNVTLLQTGPIVSQELNGTNFWILNVQNAGGGNWVLQFQLAVAGTTYTIWSSQGISAPAVFLSTGVWYHVVCTFDGANLHMYINGTGDQGPFAAATTLAITTADVFIGKDTFNNHFRGTIDEVSVYNYTLSATRALAHYQASQGLGGDLRTFNLFYGFIDRAEHSPDAGSRSTLISCVDFFEQLNIVTPKIATQYNQRADQIINTILSDIPLTDPNFINLQTGPDNIVAWGDAVTGQNTALTLFQDLMLSDQGLVFIDGAGAVTYKNRGTRYGIPTPVAIWDGAVLSAGSKPSADKRLIFNYESATRQFSQQSVNTSGTPSGGTFTLILDGQTTAALNWNATAGQVQTALQALGNVGTSGVTCTGGPLGSNPIVCNFIGFRIDLTLGANNLTGGTNPTLTITNSIASSTAQVVQDANSQKAFGIRAFSGAGGSSATDGSTNWTSDSQVSSFANFIVLVNKISRPPLRNAKLQNGAAISGGLEGARRLWQILATDVTDAITVNLTGAQFGGGAYTTGSVQSLQIDVADGGTSVTGQYTIQPTSVSTLGGLFTIGTSKLNGSDLLGY